MKGEIRKEKGEIHPLRFARPPCLRGTVCWHGERLIFALYSVICTLLSVLCYLYSVICTLLSVLCYLYSVICTLLHPVSGGQSEQKGEIRKEKSESRTLLLSESRENSFTLPSVSKVKTAKRD